MIYRKKLSNAIVKIHRKPKEFTKCRYLKTTTSISLQSKPVNMVLRIPELRYMIIYWATFEDIDTFRNFCLVSKRMRYETHMNVDWKSLIRDHNDIVYIVEKYPIYKSLFAKRIFMDNLSLLLGYCWLDLTIRLLLSDIDPNNPKENYIPRELCKIMLSDKKAPVLSIAKVLPFTEKELESVMIIVCLFDRHPRQTCTLRTAINKDIGSCCLVKFWSV